MILRPPINSGSTYFNCKHIFSVVMMTLVYADYKFLYVGVGANGRISDGGVFKGCSHEHSLENNTANFPPPTSFPGDDRPASHFIVADEAFGLKEYLIKPYPHRDLESAQRICNYRLSRARRVVENAFGILANQFRVFFTHIALALAKVEKIVLACCAHLEVYYCGNCIDLLFHMPTWAWHIYWFAILSKCFSFSISNI